jgi:uncharacterized membrane protein YhaH (DUF805 family)
MEQQQQQQEISYPEFLVKNWVDSMKRSFDFKGKTTRKEYWSLFLANFILRFLIALFVPSLSGIFQLATFFQELAALVRRYRDTDVTPWAILLIVPNLVIPFLKSRNQEQKAE